MKTCSISLLVRNDLLREGLGRLLAESDFAIAQSIDDAAELDVDLDDENHVVILDCTPDERHSISDAINIIGAYRNSKSVVLADKFDFNIMRRCFSAGACGYILNDVPYKNFVAMIKLVSMGENVVPSQFIEVINRIDIKGRDVTSAGISPRKYDLSDRDVRILDRLSLGLSNKMISRELGISEATVKVAVKTIFRKLSVNNRTQAAILAREIDLLPRHGIGHAPAVNGGCSAYL